MIYTAYCGTRTVEPRKPNLLNTVCIYALSSTAAGAIARYPQWAARLLSNPYRPVRGHPIKLVRLP